MSAPRIFTARTREEMRSIPDDEILTHWLNQPVLLFDPAAAGWASSFEEGLNELRDAHAKGNDTFRIYGGEVRNVVTEARYRWRRLVDRSTGVQHAGKAPRPWDPPYRFASERAWSQWDQDDARERANLLETGKAGDSAPVVVSQEIPFWELLWLNE